jgi:hypothetical protein
MICYGEEGSLDGSSVGQTTLAAMEASAIPGMDTAPEFAIELMIDDYAAPGGQQAVSSRGHGNIHFLPLYHRE